jgi:acetyl-CoA acyltransferase 1
MTFYYGFPPPEISEQVLSVPSARDCLLPMGITSENVASDFSVSRSKQDDFAARSFQKAGAAHKAGKFRDEIVPIKVKWTDPKSQQTKTIIVDADDGIRTGVTAESLSKLRPSFIENGSTHAGLLSLHHHISPFF